MVILAIALSGGSKNVGTFSPSPTKTPEQQKVDIKQQINQTQKKVEDLKKQVEVEERKKTESQYKGLVSISYISRSSDPKKEYVVIRVNSSATTTIPVTGWTLKSLWSGTTVTIPKATYLYFAGMINSEENIYLSPNDTLNLITGYSPNGASFKTNKCSGYLTQFQTFTPSISRSCPAPRNEDLSSIPKTVNNIACFDYINSMPSCKIQVNPLPGDYYKWSGECKTFIYDKINYPSCVNTHKSDEDFYKNEWYVYLKRNDKIWLDRSEEVVLYDHLGKIVDEIKY